jgi:hypothetical protein
MPFSQFLVLLAWLFLSAAIQIGNGMSIGGRIDNGVAISLLVLAWAATAGAVWIKASGKDGKTQDDDRPLGWALAVALVLGLLSSPGIYLQGEWFDALWRVGAGVTLGLTLAETISGGRGTFFPALFAFGVVFAFVMRILMLTASPEPMIDVFTMFQDSARHLFEGLNPYSTPVEDAYAHVNRTRDFGYSIFGYAYMPLNLLIEAPFWRLLHDVRAAHIACEMVAVAAIFRAGHGAMRTRWAILLFLFMPRGLFVIEQAWTEPMIVALFALAALGVERRPGSPWLAVAFGLMLSLKQYLVFFILHGLMVERRFSRIALAGAAAFATLIPFLIWDWRSLLDYGLLFQLRTTFRPDALTLSALLYQWGGVEISKWVSASVGLVVGGVTFAVLRDQGPAGWRLSAILTTLSIFMFGSQGFANYYYFVAAMMTFHLALDRAAPERAAAPALDVLAPQSA